MSGRPQARFAAADGGDDVVIDLLASGSDAQDIRAELELAAIEPLHLSLLDLTGSVRSSGEDRQHTKRLVELTTSVPPIIVHRPTMRVVDGVHRVRALRELNKDEVDAHLFEGDDEAAFLIGIKLNVDHGLPLTRDDRRAAADQILRCHPEWSDRFIASIVGLSDKTIAAQRKRSTAEIPQLTRRVGRDGRSRPAELRRGRRATRPLQHESGVSVKGVVRQAGSTAGSQSEARGAQLRRRITALGEDRARRSPDTSHDAVNLAGAAAAIIAQLRSDPSLRQTEAGRAVLRALASEVFKAESDSRLAEMLPTHLLGMIANLAEMRAKTLQSFATRLRLRKSRI